MAEQNQAQHNNALDEIIAQRYQEVEEIKPTAI